MENYFRTLAQTAAATQQRHLADLTGPERAMAEAIVRHQQEAFARDLYAAGTVLYPEVGPALPEGDAEGRLRQVRMIGSLRGIPLPLPIHGNEEPSPLQRAQYNPMDQQIIDTVPEVFRGPRSFRDKLSPRTGHIRTYNEPNSHSIINVTEPDHYFAHGFVQRQIVVQGDKILVRTYGEGNNHTMKQALIARP